MIGFFKRIILGVRLFFHGLFWGLRDADLTISSQKDGNDEEVNHKLEVGRTVYDDLLVGEETQQVKELRDASYRVFREADKYDVEVLGMERDGANFDNENTVLSAQVKKKSIEVKPRIDTLKTKGYKTILVQDAKEYENDIKTREQEALSGEEIDDVKTLIYNITYKDNITPRFRIERYIKKLVVEESKGKRHRLSLYFSIYARQFVKRDSLFIAELNRIFKNEQHEHDFNEIEKIEFVSDKAFGVESLHQISISNIKYKDIKIFDGNFVVTFTCKYSCDDATAKYHTEELDEKYEKKALKHDSVDIITLSRRIEKEEQEKENNYDSTILKIK